MEFTELSVGEFWAVPQGAARAGAAQGHPGWSRGGRACAEAWGESKSLSEVSRADRKLIDNFTGSKVKDPGKQGTASEERGIAIQESLGLKLRTINSQGLLQRWAGMALPFPTAM